MPSTRNNPCDDCGGILQNFEPADREQVWRKIDSKKNKGAGAPTSVAVPVMPKWEGPGVALGGRPGDHEFPAAKKRAVALGVAGLALVACVALMRTGVGRIASSSAACVGAVPYSVHVPCEGAEGENCPYQCLPGFDARGAHTCVAGAFKGGSCVPCARGFWSPGGGHGMGTRNGETDIGTNECKPCGDCFGGEVFTECTSGSDVQCLGWSLGGDSEPQPVHGFNGFRSNGGNGATKAGAAYLGAGTQPGARRDAAAWTAGGDLLLLGGSLPPGGAGQCSAVGPPVNLAFTADMWRLRPGGAWEQVQNMRGKNTMWPSARAGAATWVDGNGVSHLFGGYGYDRGTNGALGFK